jgi:acetoin utilization deacetylase AcuC-like enzyme
MKVGIVKDTLYLRHITDEYHPESRFRLESIYDMLYSIDQSDLVYVPARPATEEEIGFIHDASLISRIRDTKGKDQTWLDPDTMTSSQSYDAACMAVGGLLELTDAVITGKVDNGFALVRPPGHHAESDRAMGFCLFNNIGVAARYVQKTHGINRVLIVDFDVHHGNGTQTSFYDDPSVLYVSTHRYPFYPGSGWYTEVGRNGGEGYTINVPMSYGMGDADYAYVFSTIIAPAARLFGPEIILVSAGFDVHNRDPLGGMSVTEKGVAAMTRMLMDMAASACSGKLVFVLEGGYNIKGLTDSVETVINGLKGGPCHHGTVDAHHSASDGIVQIVSKVRQTIAPYWGEF